MMNNSNETLRKMGIVSIASIFALSLFAVSFASAAAQQRPELLISINISCLNVTFCGTDYTQVIGATAFWGGHQNTAFTITLLDSKGHIIGVVSTTWIGTWKVGSDGNFVTSGLNITTISMGHHSTTTSKHFSNFDTGTSATPHVHNCAQFFGGGPCPPGIKAEETVTFVPK